MPDYIYLLENRLTPPQRNAVKQVREAARASGMTTFLAGGAVRDLTSGSPVRDLDFTVHGNALKLKKALEKSGGELWGEHEPSRTLFFWFPGSVRVEISSARREEFPKPGKPVYHWSSILDDLRRRDFTANAMALSLNEGSYGLLLDPLNGVADIEARQLRLVSNYGFLEEPSRLLRAVRLQARLGWELDEKTRTRYHHAKDEGVLSAISPYLRGYELEEIGHEEDGLGALKALEAEGWMAHICAGWTSARADVGGLSQLHQSVTQLQIQGVNPDLSTAQMELLTARVPSKDLAGLKAALPRPGFVEQWNRLEADAKEFARLLTGKEAATASATWKLLTSYQAEPVLWLAFTSKSASVQAKFRNFFSVWPEARQKIPIALLLEMRITPQLPGYQEIVQEIFFQLIDGKLQTEDEMRAFLEPHSPPAPPPPVSIKRTRGKKAEAKFKVEDEEDEDDDKRPGLDEDEDETSHARAHDHDHDRDDDDEVRELGATAPVKAVPSPPAPVRTPPAPVRTKPESRQALAPVVASLPSPRKTATEAKKQAAKPVPKPGSKPAAKKKPAPPAKRAAKPAAVKPQARKAAKPAPVVKRATAAKKAAKPVAKSVHKKATKPAPRSKPAKAQKPAKKKR